MSNSTPDPRFERAKQAFLAGLRCQQAGEWAEAEAHYQRSLADLPGRPSTLINLAGVQLQRGQPQAALTSADQALAAEPDSADALLHRATALAQLGQCEPALATYDRLLARQPQLAPAWSARGSLLRELNRPAEAAVAFRTALDLGADAELTRYYLAAVQPDAEQPAPAASPVHYVQSLFDSYADDFDRHLVDQLHYQGYRELVDGLGRLSGRDGLGGQAGPGNLQPQWAACAVDPGCGPSSNTGCGPSSTTGCGAFDKPWSACAVDLGCGTGLCGPLTRPHAQRLIGVDLSARMLDKARALGVYDELVQADAVDFLRQTAAVVDLLLAADVFIYIGDLDPLFAAASRAMPSGLFCFSIERTAAPDLDYQLQPSLRYAHSLAYIERLASTHGFRVLAQHPAAVRDDQRVAVAGLYVYLARVTQASGTA